MTSAPEIRLTSPRRLPPENPTMIAAFFPLKKLRRSTRYLLFLAILLAGLAAVYHEMVASRAWSADTSMTSDSSSWRRAMADGGVRRDQPLNSVEDSTAWRFNYTLQTWKPEYKGQANLHVFEDWCGGSVADLRRNMHYPLYPHSRTTVQKLAVSPQWTNYGLRIFGYLHPYTDGKFVFALSSDDNSEFWLSTDDSPLNAQMLVYVGETGAEWTAPGEFNKYTSQSSKPVWLSMQRKYFFEVIHKQNDRGTDHVEVAWQLLYQGARFMVIDSKHISLYVNESALLLTDVAHIPQTAASHYQPATKQQSPTADMQKEDWRDSFYQVPLIDSSFLEGILPDCVYKPSYTIKDFPLQRYQGLQFVHMSYIYPNDFTRLTHMETENSCFYLESPSYMKMFGLSRYMSLDRPESQGKGKSPRDFGFQKRKSAIEDDYHQNKKEIRPEKKDNVLFLDYGDDYDDYIQRRRRRLFSMVTDAPKSTADTALEQQDRQKEVTNTTQNISPPHPESARTAEPAKSAISLTSKHLLHLRQNQSKLNKEGQFKRVEPLKPKRRLGQAKRARVRSVEATGKSKAVTGAGKEQLHTKETQEQLGPKQLHVQRAQKKTEAHQKPKQPKFEAEKEEEHIADAKRANPGERFIQRDPDAKTSLREKEIEMNMPLQQDVELDRPVRKTKEKFEDKWSEPKEEKPPAWGMEEDDGDFNERANGKRDRESVWGAGDDFEGKEEEDPTPSPVFDTDVNWSQTFQIKHLDFQAYRSDSIDLRCNISGNLLLEARDALSIVKAFEEKLNEKHQRQFTVRRVVNVVKRVDGVQGDRYLLELELRDARGRLHRLSHYVYALTRHSRRRSKDFGFHPMKPQLLLCNPVGFRWGPATTVHFIVPVKNQARWVQQLIGDMEQLYRLTRDINFSLIITDYNSTDMDVRKALEKSSLPRYEYVKLTGNFERSAGLQAGIDLITDDHSIVFLCDLHIHFPPSIIDTIRKHCVEGYMAFAPVVLRLDCGATPSEAKGYWEVNGFGLLGIYKSDLDRVGGMNTREFTDRWGGEDWELLDRILQAGLEVERIYLRNFFHHYHSKRGMWNRRMMPKHT